MICLFFLTEFTNVTDTHTDTTHRERETPCDDIGRTCIASRGKKCIDSCETKTIMTAPSRRMPCVHSTVTTAVRSCCLCARRYSAAICKRLCDNRKHGGPHIVSLFCDTQSLVLRVFLPRDATHPMLSCGVCPSVRMSVCHVHVLYRN